MTARRRPDRTYLAATGDHGEPDEVFRWFPDEVAPGLTLVQSRVGNRDWTSLTHDGSGLAIVGWYRDVRWVRRWLRTHGDELRALDWTLSASAIRALATHWSIAESHGEVP